MIRSATNGLIGFVAGFRAFFQGYALINRHSLWRFVFLPSFISLLVGLLIIVGVYIGLSHLILQFSEWAINATAGLFGFVFEAGKVPGWLAATGRFFTRVIAASAGVVVNIILYRTMVSIIVIPFMGPLLNEVEKIRLGRSIEVSLGADIRNSLLGVFVAVKFALAGLFVLPVSLPLGPFAVLVNAPAQGYFLGRGAFDYIFEKESESVLERRKLVRRYRSEILGLGLAYFLVLLIPVFGVVVAPPASIAAAALIHHPDEESARTGNA